MPENGRGYEGFGEDPLLVADMGVAEIEGIQSEGTLAQAKHLVAYSQEADRGQVDEVVSERALQEIYLHPFKAAIQQAHVDSLMCAYPQLNGVFQCQDPTLTSSAGRLGLHRLRPLRPRRGPRPGGRPGRRDRPDQAGQHRPPDPVGAGGLLPVADVDAAVTRVLTSMFAAGLVGRDDGGTPPPRWTAWPTPWWPGRRRSARPSCSRTGPTSSRSRPGAPPWR